MHPNLGGFFMVRSYYPSECHADYFDFERIEAVKPAIEACGNSTLYQSPMLGFHKQMDNRIKLLEEILSFRMQGFFFQAEDGIRDKLVTGVQTCAHPISRTTCTVSSCSRWMWPRTRRPAASWMSTVLECQPWPIGVTRRVSGGASGNSASRESTSAQTATAVGNGVLEVAAGAVPGVIPKAI